MFGWLAGWLAGWLGGHAWLVRRARGVRLRQRAGHPATALKIVDGSYLCQSVNCLWMMQPMYMGTSMYGARIRNVRFSTVWRPVAGFCGEDGVRPYSRRNLSEAACYRNRKWPRSSNLLIDSREPAQSSTRRYDRTRPGGTTTGSYATAWRSSRPLGPLNFSSPTPPSLHAL